MASDARSHIVPANTDHPSRATLLNLALNIRDVIPTATTTTRAAIITAMAAAGVSVSTTNPVYVHRANARPDSAIEVTTDGTTWLAIPLTTLQNFTDTPVLGASTTAPTLGTGSSVAGTHAQVGQWVSGTGVINFGTSGVVAGSGSYTISLPVAAVASEVANGGIVGFGTFFDSSAGRFYGYHMRLVTSTTARLVELSAGTFFTNASPVAPAVSDVYNYTFGYIPA